MNKYIELALEDGWIDVFYQEGKLFGFRDRSCVMPEQIILPRSTLERVPLKEMYLLFCDR